MTNEAKKDLWIRVFNEVNDMTEAELVAALAELGAPDPVAAYQATQEDEIGGEWFLARAITREAIFNK